MAAAVASFVSMRYVGKGANAKKKDAVKFFETDRNAHPQSAPQNAGTNLVCLGFERSIAG